MRWAILSLWILLVLNVIMLGYIGFKINTEGAQCSIDPLVYGAKQLEDANKYPVSCSCSLITPNPSQTLHFNSEGKSFASPFSLAEQDFNVEKARQEVEDTLSKINISPNK